MVDEKWNVRNDTENTEQKNNRIKTVQCAGGASIDDVRRVRMKILFAGVRACVCRVTLPVVDWRGWPVRRNGKWGTVRLWQCGVLHLTGAPRQCRATIGFCFSWTRSLLQSVYAFCACRAVIPRFSLFFLCFFCTVLTRMQSINVAPTNYINW